ncbi:uncharacterized protein si:dkey-172o19.2 isoform X1 [Cyprinodon tularosa]|uniref:uncharacterized protein si:dkey-172o19.2 isoform X1 n=1 Tax=Cyprinodon tularosa TaxID=77115 RepID=UPI0018E27B49|nr:uncharacterized protein si:dkey-172o19.2 isoform X1 [Cyprinodon tularosa]
MSTRSPKVSEAPASCQPSSSCLDSSRVLDPAPDLGAVPVARPPLLARRLVRLRACRSHLSPVRRRKREMIPADKKDASYWDKRRKNNEAAKRSREKRRINDLLMEGQLLALSEENAQLRAQVLNLQYHTNLSVEQGKTASACAASPASVLASTLPLSPHSPAFLQVGLWRQPGISSAAVSGVRQRETALNQLEGKIPCFNTIYNPLGHHYLVAQGPMRLSGPRVLSHGESAGVCRPAEVDIDSHRQVNSEDISMSADASPQPFSALPGLLSPFDPHHTSTVPYPHPNWVLPHLNHPAMWRPSYLQKPTVYPGRSVQMQGRHAQRVGVEEHIQRRLMSRLSTEQ